MYAVITTGGKQLKVAKGSVYKIEKVTGEPGAKVEFENVLMLGNGARSTMIGTPFVKGAKVIGEIIGQARDPKVIIFKKKRRHNYRRKNGHRQYMTHIKITDIVAS